MRNTPQRNNPLERAVRARLHRAGLRFRVHYRPLTGQPGEADIAFTAKKVLVQIDGCFWHGCPVHATRPASNGDWWRDKLERNIERDIRLTATMSDAGWQVMRYWEHEGAEFIAAAVIRAVREHPPVACLAELRGETLAGEGAVGQRILVRPTGA